jgi:hypothetical protein
MRELKEDAMPLPTVHPLRGRGRLSTHSFDERRAGGAHNAHDIVAPSGTPIVAATSGRVIKVYRDGRAPVGAGDRAPTPGEAHVGNGVAIRDDDGWTHIYAHMRDIPLVRPHTRVEAGELLGYVGTTGRSDGPHLHYSIDRGARRVDATDRLRTLAVEAVDPPAESSRGTTGLLPDASDWSADEIRRKAALALAWQRDWRPAQWESEWEPWGRPNESGQPLARAVLRRAMMVVQQNVTTMTQFIHHALATGNLEDARRRAASLQEYVHRMHRISVEQRNNPPNAVLANARRVITESARNAALAVLPEPGGTMETALIMAALVALGLWVLA